MRSLRERLQAVASQSAPARETRPARAEPFFCRERTVELSLLRGVEETTLNDVRACDPLFAGDRWNPQRLLFLDTETTGLSGGAGTIAFEIGVGFLTDEGMVIRQYVMRDYGEEAAMLREIASLLSRSEALVTFNGKSFDIPLLESRMIMQRIRVPVSQMPHLDLLHACRRVYKLRLGRCNLTALEAAVLGKARDDDLPGSQAPQRYFDYLKSGEFALLEDVLRHNFEDVQSLAELTGELCRAYREPQRLSHPQDLYGVGRTLLRGGQTERARRCLRIVGCSTLAPQAHRVLADSYKRGREWPQVIETCEQMIAAGEGGVWPYEELAKYYEHVARDLPAALRCASGALAFSLNAAPLRGEDPQQTQRLTRRIRRIKGKLAAERADRKEQTT